ncbi:MAG: zf-HC2 domain-containing protein, partial [Planctomycetota bacterium]|nr:zf-HC2 domain-containing protein [Planctomycetota bacterium]
MTVITHCEEIAPRIPPYVESTLPSGERGAVDAHLQHCPSCRTALKRFAQLQAFARTTLGPGVLPPEFGAETGQRMTHITTGSLPVMKADEDLAEAPTRPWFDRIQDRLGAAPWWMISGAFHALLLLMLTLIGMALLRSGEKEVVIVTNLEKRPEPEEIKQQLPRDVFKNPVPVEMTEVTPEPAVVTHEEVEVAEHAETANETDANEARGTNGLTDVDLGG